MTRSQTARAHTNAFNICTETVGTIQHDNNPFKLDLEMQKKYVDFIQSIQAGTSQGYITDASGNFLLNNACRLLFEVLEPNKHYWREIHREMAQELEDLIAEYNRRRV